MAATITAFGGGTLLAAIALELVPEADRAAGPLLTAARLIAGTLVYVGADAWLNRDPSMKAMRRSGPAAAAGRSMSMPKDRRELTRGESIALGLTIAEGEIGVVLLAGIVVGNLHPPRLLRGEQPGGVGDGGRIRRGLSAQLVLRHPRPSRTGRVR